MKDFLITLLEAVLIAAIPVLTAYAVKFLQAKSEQAAVQIENETAQAYLAEITSAVTTAVTATSQTYVDSLKASGAFTKEAQIEALLKAKDTALSILSAEAREFVEQAYGDITTYLEAKIEETVRNTKTATATLETATIEVASTDAATVAATTAASVAAAIATTAVEQLKTEISVSSPEIAIQDSGVNAPDAQTE